MSKKAYLMRIQADDYEKDHVAAFDEFCANLRTVVENTPYTVHMELEEPKATEWNRYVAIIGTDLILATRKVKEICHTVEIDYVGRLGAFEEETWFVFRLWDDALDLQEETELFGPPGQRAPIEWLTVKS